MTTIKLTGGDLGRDVMMVCCDLSRAESPVRVDYCNDEPSEYGTHWEPTQYQCADARHRTSGLIEIGKLLAAHAVEVPADEFSCTAEEVDA